MLPLITGNRRKYAPLGDLLARMDIDLRVPEFDFPEWQGEGFLDVLQAKARHARAQLGVPCLVDDSGLLLDAYPGFPGPMTRAVCRQLGAEGLLRLLSGATPRARMVCYLGCQTRSGLRHWRGEVAGRLDPRRPTADGPGPLAQWFVPDDGIDGAALIHRRRALESLENDLPALREEVRDDLPAAVPPVLCSSNCVFCREFAGLPGSLFHELTGGRIASRIVYRTEHFRVFPPLGQFVEGGLLVATEAHLLSMAHLPPAYYGELDALMAEIDALLAAHYGCRPLFFEHAPLAPGDKGTCCVDHAHLNVFPVAVDVHRRLERFPHAPLRSMRELAGRATAGSGYLFLQTNDGDRYVYDSGIVPSQYIRRLITAALGFPERWHWRDYPGLDELERTIETLAPWRRSYAVAS